MANKREKLKAVYEILNKVWILEPTVRGFGSRMRLISFLAPAENHDGQEKSALQIWNVYKHVIRVFQATLILCKKESESAYFSIQGHKIWLIKRQESSHKDKENHPTRPNIRCSTVITFVIEHLMEKISYSETIHILEILQSQISIISLIDTSGAT